MGADGPGRADTRGVDPFDRLRLAGKRVADPLESLAQRVAERVIDLVVQSLDVNELVQRIDVNAVLDEVDLDRPLNRVDLDAVLNRVDVDALLDRIDVEALLD